MTISQTGIFVEDPVKAHAFYTEVLDFKTKKFSPEAQIAIVVSPEDSNGTSLLLEPRGDSFAKTYRESVYELGLPIIIFGTGNLKKERAELESKGVKFRDDLTKPFRGIENMFEETFGNLIMLAEEEEEEG